MPPVPKRLSVVSYSGPYPTLSITNEQFDQLQGIYGVELSIDDRCSVQAIANDFLRWRLLELVSHKRSETKNLFRKVKEAVGPFVIFAEGGLLGKGDAAGDLEGRLAEHYAQLFVRVQPNHIRFPMEDGTLEMPDLQHPIVVTLNATVLMNVAHGLVEALRRVERSIEGDTAEDKGFAPGRAFHDFLWQLRDWAKAAGHPISPFKQATKHAAFNAPDKVAAPFTAFIFALNDMFRFVRVPEGVRTADGSCVGTLHEIVESEEALGERLKCVAAEANAFIRRGG